MAVGYEESELQAALVCLKQIATSSGGGLTHVQPGKVRPVDVLNPADLLDWLVHRVSEIYQNTTQAVEGQIHVVFRGLAVAFEPMPNEIQPPAVVPDGEEPATHLAYFWKPVQGV